MRDEGTGDELRQRMLAEVGSLCRRIAELERELSDQRELTGMLRRELEKKCGASPDCAGRGLVEDLRKGQKMEALGLLAGGVAHDMNNVLGAIMSLASVLKDETSPDDKRYRDVEDILTATRRGRELTRNLLGFAREGKYVKDALSLNEVAIEAHGLLSRTTPRSVLWLLDLEEQLPPVEGDFGQIAQALVNVCLNAVEAMRDGGDLAISTRKVYLGLEELASWPRLAPGSYVLLKVRDTGVGMDEETLRRAFEPFFSTKPRDEGTGLGLSMVYGTVTNHGGMVEIRSAPGKGTSVSIYLPRVRAGSGELRESREGGEARNEGTVLLVDDEELLRRSTRRALERLGFRVLEAVNGEEAVELVASEKARISLVLLDVIMPVMDGVEAFGRIRQIDPGMPVIVTSGYSREGKVDELLKLGASGFIEKPYDLEKLAKHVRLSKRS
jgi:signal transduction histidine kinase/CheY-like chemotaxis protein